ncbi:hypothetical protein [Flavihumibacter fluvii]|nr:hypothetical protein [Flavihumibacter fluvii]ULQ54009.1 hypothetical protein KJS93_06715 [Flavihumibacter fluvii]
MAINTNTGNAFAGFSGKLNGVYTTLISDFMKNNGDTNKTLKIPNKPKSK